MREFVNAILAAIGTSSLTDLEFELITETTEDYTKELYDQILLVLDSRDIVADTRDRLTFYFKSKGVQVTASSPARSEVFLGGGLDGDIPSFESGGSLGPASPASSIGTLATKAKQDIGNGFLESINDKLPELSGGRIPVEIDSFPAPTGSATEDKQDDQIDLLQLIADSVDSIDDDTPALVGGRVPVDGSGVTQPISVSSLPLPTGAATGTKQDTGNASLASIDSKLGSLGQKAMAASAPVVIASDQSAIPVSIATAAAGRSSVTLVRNLYTGTPVTTAAYVQIVASLPDTVNQLFIFDSSGQTLVLAVGGAGAEVDKAYVIPGGNGELNLLIPSGSRVSLKAVSANATVGEFNATFLK